MNLYGKFLCAALFGLGALLGTETAEADEAAQIDTDEPINLLPYMAVLPDPENALGIEDVSSAANASAFQPLDGGSVNLGIVGHPYWFKLQLENAGNTLRKKALELNNPRLSKVEFYEFAEDGSHASRQAGVLTPIENHPWVSPEPAFAVNIAPNSSKSIYIRVSHNGGLRFRANLWERGDYRRHGAVIVGLCGFFVGAIALVALYNFVVFIDLRERSYLYLALLATMLVFYVLSKNGFARMLIWGAWPWWADRADMAMLAIVLAWTVLFADAFLNGARYAPALSRWSQVMAAFFMLEAPLALTDYTVKYYLLHVSGFVGVVLVSLLAWRSLRAGFAPAKPFIRALGPVIVGMAFLSLLGPGMLPTSAVTEYGVELSFILTGALWLQSLTSRLHTQEAEHRAHLETRVDERTSELSRALAEVKTLSGLVPMCSSCKKIRDDKGYWNSVEAYIEDHSDAQFSHGLCPTCVHETFAEYFEPDEEIEC